jgi:hypothetical protein
LALTIDFEQGVQVEAPPFGQAVGDFIVRDFREPLLETKGDRKVLRHVYTLEPTATGPQQIDPIAVTFTDGRAGGDGKQHTFETEALTIEIISVVGSDAPSLDDLQDFADPVELPASRAWIWLLVIPGLLLPLAAVLAWRVLRRTSISSAEEVTPFELAQRELERLWRDRVCDKDVKEFYVALTGIVRRYIEGTTGIQAPEQTTEEFLRAIGGGEAFGREERQRLRDFLESADLVKFAAHQPGQADIEESYHRALRFVGLAVAEETAA